MDSDLYTQAIQYEQLTQSIYQCILQEESDTTTQVKHNETVKGRSGVEHQIDVLWQFTKASVNHTVLVECKNYSSSLTLEKVRNFFAVVHDIGSCQGVMVTKVGYQAGAAQFAKFYGINLKVLRKPTPADWKGRIKDISLTIVNRQLVSTLNQPVIVNCMLGAKDEAQVKRIAILKDRNRLQIGNPALIQFSNSKNELVDEILAWWLPKQLSVIDKTPGGPYKQKIPLTDRWILVNAGESDEELIPIIELDVTYFIEEFNNQEVVLHGEAVIQAILKDYNTEEIEGFKRSS